MSFKTEVFLCPNHELPDGVLLQCFHQSLDSINKSSANNRTGGSLMDQTFKLAKDIMTKTNRAWNTRDGQVTSGVNSNVMTNEWEKRKTKMKSWLKWLLKLSCWQNTLLSPVSIVPMLLVCKKMSKFNTYKTEWRVLPRGTKVPTKALGDLKTEIKVGERERARAYHR